MDPRSKITEASEIELAVDTSRLYFFDPETRRRRRLALDGTGGEAGEDSCWSTSMSTISGTVTMTVAAMIWPHGSSKALRSR